MRALSAGNVPNGSYCFSCCSCSAARFTHDAAADPLCVELREELYLEPYSQVRVMAQWRLDRVVPLTGVAASQVLDTEFTLFGPEASMLTSESGEIDLLDVRLMCTDRLGFVQAEGLPLGCLLGVAPCHATAAKHAGRVREAILCRPVKVSNGIGNCIWIVT